METLETFPPLLGVSDHQDHFPVRKQIKQYREERCWRHISKASVSLAVFGYERFRMLSIPAAHILHRLAPFTAVWLR